MFSKLAVSFVSLVALATSAAAGPLALRPAFELSTRTLNFPSLSHWGGFSSLDNFDNFYGSDNFDGSHSSQVIIKKEKEVVCHTQKIEIIQQQLVVLQEMAKRIITEQVCEVETQTIIFKQWHSSLSRFSYDLRRMSGHQVGYDSHISSLYGSLLNSDGSFSGHDLGFSGHDVGSQTVVVGGSNWNDQSSPARVHDAFTAAQNAFHAVHPELQ